jgi:hydrogenase maturation factor
MEYLSKLLDKYRGSPDSSVLIGPGIGEDAAVIDTGAKELLVVKTDPITFASENIGEYTVTVNANDISCMGGKPRWFLVTILLPDGRTDEDLIDNIFSQLSRTCEKLGIAICGGHTEVTFNLNRPVVVGQMIGTVSPERLIRSSDALPGDHVILTKGVAVEATSIIAREKGTDLMRHFGSEFIEHCRNFLHDPGISILKEAEVALNEGGVHALHDPTEGGIATGLHELAIASGVGLEVWHDRIMVFSETRTLCDLYNLDPFGIIASGALLIAAAPSSSHRIQDALISEGIYCDQIGVIKDQSEGVKIIKGNKYMPLRRFDQDEIALIF